MDAQLCVKKKLSQCNGTRILPGKCWSTVRGFLTVHSINNYLVIYIMIFWFSFTCIKISARQTNSSRSLTSILNLPCAYDVTCSYDVIMRK